MNMDTFLLERLDHVEKALNKAIDSISSYNPSVPAAAELLHADDQLTEGIRLLATHQINYAQIQSLRSDIMALNTVTRNSLSRLVSVREEVLSIPLPAPHAGLEHKSVKYADLLDYASKISRYTMPPKRVDGNLTFLESQILRGSAASHLGAEGNDESALVAGPSALEPGFGVTQLQEAEVQWLHPERLVSFSPWPTEEVIQRGALAAITRGETKGLGPAQAQEREINTKGAESQNLSDARAEETSKQAQAGVAQGSSLTGEIVEQKPKVFGGLDLYDPDMEG